ncbi:MAG: hypothetical protein K9I26_07870 [Flavobacterium sp.]|nr:hypothetical protein [Flavobacterium sp.]
MIKEIRVKEIENIEKNDKPIGKIEIPWKDNLEPMDVYQIPLRLLVYNKYNGRILSRTKSIENQKNKIDAETDEGKKLIEKLLWDSKPSKNKETLESLKGGQEKVGIITKEGIIIDGNRRAMLLNKIDTIDYFKAVILPVEYDGNPLEIEKFETKYQLGEERKLDYNPIEIYLKLQRLYQQLSGQSRYPTESDLKNGIKVDKNAIKQIYQWVGNYKNINSVGDIEYTLQVINLMDEYLDYHDYNGIYTALDEREEQFRGLTNWLNNFFGEDSSKPFDGYKNSDVVDLQALCFELIRLKFKNEKFRYIAQGQRPNHFFGSKEIWESFKKNHEEILEKHSDSEIDYNSTNIEAHLNSRDSDFKNKVGSLIDENVDNHYQKLRNKQAQDEPIKLLNKALDSFESINPNSKNFAKTDALNLTEKLANVVITALQKKSPSRVLNHIIDLLESIDIENIPEEEIEDIQIKTKRIQQIGYQINKQL